jgi:uncharacterized membrane protein YccC
VTILDRLGGRVKTVDEPDTLEDDLCRTAEDLAAALAELEDTRSLLEVRSAALGEATERAEALERENVRLTQRNEQLEQAAFPSLAEILEREPEEGVPPVHIGLDFLTLPARIPVPA